MCKVDSCGGWASSKLKSRLLTVSYIYWDLSDNLLSNTKSFVNDASLFSVVKNHTQSDIDLRALI